MAQVELNKSLDQYNDKEVWGLFRSGDRHAFGYIYHTNVKQLFNYGMKIQPENEVVEDAIQELFIELWDQRERLSDTNKIHFYLLRALRSKILRKLDTQKRYAKRIQNQSTEQEKVILPYEHLLINQQISDEKKQKLYKALKKLPDRQREVIHLYFYNGYTYNKISELMSMNIRSVYNLAWKAVTSLKKYI